MIPRLKTTYDKEIVTKLMSKLNLKNKHQVPKINKIVLNMGLGEDASDSKKLKSSVEDMALIAGQKPIITKFKKSISNFKTRKGSNAGVKITLRSNNRAKIKDLNMVKKHVKTTKEKKGGIISKENYINISNLAIIDQKKDTKTTKVAQKESKK